MVTALSLLGIDGEEGAEGWEFGVLVAGRRGLGAA